MFRNENLELKVGLFMGAGIFLMFLIVFTISDFYLLKDGYDVYTEFSYVNGITVNSPVRLAGVHVGEVKGIKIYYNEEEGRTRVRLDVRVKGGVRIESDAVARINTLGLLGEQYLEISPGQSKRTVSDGESITGRDPANVGRQMEKMSELVGSVSEVFKKIEQGDGTIGKLIGDDTLYNDLVVIFDRLRNGEGTIGKLLTEDKVYDDMEDFVSDIKAHPWKLLHKTSDRGRRSDDEEEDSRGTTIQPAR